MRLLWTNVNSYYVLHSDGKRVALASSAGQTVQDHIVVMSSFFSTSGRSPRGRSEPRGGSRSSPASVCCVAQSVLHAPREPVSRPRARSQEDTMNRILRVLPATALATFVATS